MGLNVCIVCGRMGGDPEFRQTQGGNPVSNFSIACDRDYKNQDGTKQTDWFQCVCFGKTAEFISRYGKKGRSVIVNGRLQVREWTDNNGGKRTVTEILVNNAQFADSPQHENPPDSGYGGGGQNAPYQQGQSAGYGGGYGGYGGGYGGR